MTQDNKQKTQPEIQLEIPMPLPPLQRVRIHYALVTALGGFLVFLIGAQPGLFGLDRSPIVGFIQITVMLIGIGIICLCGYIAIHLLWRKQPPSIVADIGLRVVSTGYVIAAFSGLADVFGIGSHPLPGVPVFGVWQARGMEVGLTIIAIGFLMMFPFRNPKNHKVW